MTEFFQILSDIVAIFSICKNYICMGKASKKNRLLNIHPFTYSHNYTRALEKRFFFFGFLSLFLVLMVVCLRKKSIVEK